MSAVAIAPREHRPDEGESSRPWPYRAQGQLWVHPLDVDLVRYREYGKGHTLPTFWCICQRCEDLYRAGRDEDLVEIMKASSGSYWDSDDDIEGCLRQPLAVFRRAAKGGRRMTAGGPRNDL